MAKSCEWGGYAVFVEGAKLSMGDMHFSQGDGEVSFCGAIEMSGFLELKCALCLCAVATCPPQDTPCCAPQHCAEAAWSHCRPATAHRLSSQWILRRCEIYRGGMEQYLTPMGPTKLHVNPIFEISPLEPRFSEWLVFEGLSVDESGRQHYLDATVAFKRAILNCIDYLHKFGYTKEQVVSPFHCLYELIL